MPRSFNSSNSIPYPKTYDLIKCSFFWNGLKNEHTSISECDVSKGTRVKQ